MKRRTFIKRSAISTLAAHPFGAAFEDILESTTEKIEILNPLGKVPVSFIIDDSTALVNLAYYGIPQFAEVFPNKYKQDWRTLPREIPDSFVARFIDWCGLHGVKGKYSMVPYPACTGWLHRFIPGWTRQQLKSSLELVRNDMVRDWDIHPEMISHTRVVDIKTGLPYPHATPAFMENWEWSQDKSSDELGEYIAYALTVLKDAGLYCEGVTTPGGFCSRNVPNLAIGTHEAVQDVHGAGISHFFRDLYTKKGKSVSPVIMHSEGIDTDNPSCSVHIIGCTGDWFGGWDGLTPGDPDKFITADLTSGRMVEVIESGEPAIMVCHWPGIYYNGEEHGFNVFKKVVERLEGKYGNGIHWMKLSEIARYWAAREFVRIESTKNGLLIDAPFGTADFTLKLADSMKNPVLKHGEKILKLNDLGSRGRLQSNGFSQQAGNILLCFDLPAGRSELIKNWP